MQCDHYTLFIPPHPKSHNIYLYIQCFSIRQPQNRGEHLKKHTWRLEDWNFITWMTFMTFERSPSLGGHHMPPLLSTEPSSLLDNKFIDLSTDSLVFVALNFQLRIHWFWLPFVNLQALGHTRCCPRGSWSFCGFQTIQYMFQFPAALRHDWSVRTK